MILEYLELMCEETGIVLIAVEEAYTSCCSAIDDEPIGKKDSYFGVREGSTFRTRGDKATINADINGAMNIWRLANTPVDSNGNPGPNPAVPDRVKEIALSRHFRLNF